MSNPIDPAYDQAVSAIHNRLFFRMFQAGVTLERRATKEIGVTSIQWSVLGALSRPKVANGMPLSELAEYLRVSRQNLDSVLKRLERDGQVQRIADPVDRRAKLVLLTPEGRNFWNKIQPKIYEFYRQALIDFRFDDKVAFVHYLNKVRDGMEKIDLSEIGLAEE